MSLGKKGLGNEGDCGLEKFIAGRKEETTFLNQKRLLDTFLEKNAISQAPYDKSIRDFRDKMRMHGV